MIAVIDTNVLVSALWKPGGNASLLISHVLNGRIQPCYDYRIMEEYREVLMRPKFKFSRQQVDLLLDTFIMDGISVIAKPLPDVIMNDEDDRPFFEVAKDCNVPLVTGNIKDYPEDPLITSLAEFCQKYLC